MPFYVEVHCGYGEDTDDRARHSDMGCWSFTNDNPGVMTNTLRGITPKVTGQARSMKWKYRSGQWHCPHCQRKPLVVSGVKL